MSHATLSVRGSTVRSWILPEALNVDALLVDDTPKKSQSAAAIKSMGRGGGGGLAPGSSGGRGRGRGRGRGSMGGGRR